MRKFAFISRHTPTDRQHELAANRGIELVPFGDADAFLDPRYMLMDLGGCPEIEGVVVVHPMLALNLIEHYDVLIFENGNRAPEGERPQFEAVAAHLAHKRPPARLVETGDEQPTAAMTYGGNTVYLRQDGSGFVVNDETGEDFACWSEGKDLL